MTRQIAAALSGYFLSLILTVVILTVLIFAPGNALHSQPLDLPVVRAQTPGLPVFVFNNAFNTRGTPYSEIAGLLAELGYDGIEHREVDGIIQLKEELDRKDLKIFTDYVRIDLDAGDPYLREWKEVLPELAGTGLILWVHIHSEQYGPSDRSADAEAVPILRELADLAAPHGIRIAIYPHAGFVAETPEDSYRLAELTGRENVGAVFNLCHYLKTEGDRDPEAVIEKIMPRLIAVSLSGADSGETRNMGWDQLIQPLGEGSYEVYPVVKALLDNGYRGPVGFQCYRIEGDPADFLQTSMQTWKGYMKRYQSEQP